MRQLIKHLVLFLVGGFIYYLIECLWRGYSHISMFIVGGLALVAIGYINIYLEWTTPLWLQCLIATAIILVLEFSSGCVVNLWLGLNVWDYSHISCNILGQICLPFAGLWYLLSVVGIVLDDVIRCLLFEEQKPKYTIF